MRPKSGNGGRNGTNSAKSALIDAKSSTSGHQPDRITPKSYGSCGPPDGSPGQQAAAKDVAQNTLTGRLSLTKVKGRKRHILIDTLGLILKANVHSAGIQDRDGAALVFDRLAGHFPFIMIICGDGAYQGPVVQASSPMAIEIVKRNQPGFEVLPKRWSVERTFAWLGINRRLSKDF